eukprot:1837063-Prymnesium_polylepis.1
MQLRDGWCEFAVVRVNGKLTARASTSYLPSSPALEGWRVAVSAAVVGFTSSIVVQHSSVVVAAASAQFGCGRGGSLPFDPLRR